MALYDLTDLRQAACHAQGGHQATLTEMGVLFDLMKCERCGAQHVVIKKGKPRRGH